MKIVKSKKKNNTVYLEIEEDESALLALTDSAFKRIVKGVKVKGFREGKVPRSVFERLYGKDMIIQEAMIDVINSTYRKAIEDLSLEVIDQPKNVDVKDYKEGQPITLTCEVDVKPEIKVSKYKKLKLKKSNTEITPAQIDGRIQQFLDRYSEFILTNNPIDSTHIIKCDIDAKINDTPVAAWCQTNTVVRLGSKTFGEDFDNELIGLTVGTQKKISLSYPDTFQQKDVAGQTVDFILNIHEAREKKCPELTDAFVKEKTSLDTIDMFKTQIKQSLQDENDRQGKDDLTKQIFDQLTKNTKCELPEPMIERELDVSLYFLEQNLKQSGISMDAYLQMMKKTKVALREDFREAATRRVHSDLIVDYISKTENITASTLEIEQEIATWNQPNMTTIEDVQNNPRMDLDKLKYSIIERKTIDFLIESAKLT